MLSRRDFISKSALTAGLLSLTGLNNKIFGHEQFKRIQSLSPTAAASDEDFWSWVRESFTVNRNIAYLNSAGVNPQPKGVQDAHIESYRFCNEGPANTMWRIVDQGREPLRARLAEISGCSADEIAINRNSTEGLNTIIFGLNLKAGDEVVLSKYDYPNMMNAWKQREKREGIKLVWIDEFEFPLEDDQKIVDTYARAITAKTKIVHITHLINWVGQIVPARKIADMAHGKGCEVILDGAQSFAHFDYKIPDTGCDYYATSLHKWLCAPFGSGMMYIKKDKIKNVWALLSAVEPDGDNIRKFESLGTRSFASEMAIGNAIDFHQAIGMPRKEARLRYLKDYWCNKVKDIPKVKLYTSLKPQYSCTMANFAVEGWTAGQINSKLYDDHKVFTVGIEYEKVNGVRVSPNVFTSLDELDRLVDGIKAIASSEPPVKK
jgi:selenocysteine lyase/cysteine desulfurase